MANPSVAPYTFADPEHRRHADAEMRRPPVVWWPLATLIAVVALFDPLTAMTPHTVYLVAVVVAVALGTNLAIPGQPMRLRVFDGCFLLLLFYMAFNITARILTRSADHVTSAADTEALLRFLRLTSQICVLYVVFSNCSARPSLAARCLQLVWWIAIASCIFAVLQFVGQQTGAFDLFFEYQRFRRSGVWQVTGQFAEPAFFGQFLVAALFIFFSTIDQIRRHWLVLGLIVGTASLTQSVGTLFGMVAWAVFLIVYNYRNLLSLRRLDTKIVVVVLVGVAIVLFNTMSRLSLLDLVSMDLDASGQHRVIGEFLAFAYLVERGVDGGLLFGLGEAAAQTARSAIGYGDAQGMNGVVELALRYGVFLLVLLWALFTTAAGFVKGLFLFAIFALLAQIDGAVAKPYIWLYTALIALSLIGTRSTARHRTAGTARSQEHEPVLRTTFGPPPLARAGTHHLPPRSEAP